MKRFSFRILAIGGGCFAAILIGEVFLRISDVWIGRHSDTMFSLVEYNPYLGWQLKPHLNEKVDLVDVENIPVKTNSLGFWDREFQLEKPSDVCRILFLGDSFTWGMGVYEEERFTDLLQTSNPQWETLNFGVPGYGTDQALLLWQRLVHSFRPDVMVLTIYDNDYKDNMHLVRYGRRKPYFELSEAGDLVSKGLPVEETDFWDDGVFNQAAPPYLNFFNEPVQKRPRAIHWLAKNSDLARLVYTRLRSTSVIAKLPEAAEAISKSQEVELLTALVTQLSKEVQTIGATFLAAFAGNLTREHQSAMALLEEKGISTIDLTTEVLEQQITLEKESVYYRYSKHWTPAAHRAAALVLETTLWEGNFCE